MLSSMRHTDCDFGPCCSMMTQVRSWPWIDLLGMDGGATIDFSFDFFLSFAYSLTIL
ncbi:hypothetical protein BAE44_0024527 [Dichanthelium oligosanthes]|uniref:Uncharacterized protein n=1 Tax=Dichanthelium oligosanthes TaxID=888268 RepID=A0A1E5UNI8_9POAL|nr:hypothetical protein BAE44_0024527 [Dichanthelium oligosanthes]